MSRSEAFEVVRRHGGTPSQTVTRQTNVLVIGELGWPLLDDSRPSNKLSRAGIYGVPVVSERRFLEWIGKAVPDSLNRTYSAEVTPQDSLATLWQADDAVATIMRW
jgi:BRCT domain type II-containing protein